MPRRLLHRRVAARAWNHARQCTAKYLTRTSASQWSKPLSRPFLLTCIAVAKDQKEAQEERSCAGNWLMKSRARTVSGGGDSIRAKPQLEWQAKPLSHPFQLSCWERWALTLAEWVGGVRLGEADRAEGEQPCTPGWMDPPCTRGLDGPFL